MLYEQNNEDLIEHGWFGKAVSATGKAANDTAKAAKNAKNATDKNARNINNYTHKAARKAGYSKAVSQQMADAASSKYYKDEAIRIENNKLANDATESKITKAVVQGKLTKAASIAAKSKLANDALIVAKAATESKIANDALIVANMVAKSKITKDIINTTEQAANDTADWTEQAANDAADWTEQAANDAADWTEQAANDAADLAEKTANDAADLAEKTANDAADLAKKLAKDALNSLNSLLKMFGNLLKKIQGPFADILKFMKKIIAFWKKLKPLFKKYSHNATKIWNSSMSFFKGYKKLEQFLKGPIKIIAGIITFTIPILGQLVSRLILYNGSMDLPWLMFFAIPPFTIVPVVAMSYDYIKPLKGGSPWDNLVWLPIIAILFGSHISSTNKMMNIFKIILGIGSFYLAYSAKSAHICRSKNTNLKVTLDSINSYMMVIVFSLIMPLMPIVGTYFGMLQTILPKSELFIQAFVIFFVYVGTNIFNGTYNRSCNTKIKEIDVHKVLLTSILLTLLLSNSSGNMSSKIMKIMNIMKK